MTRYDILHNAWIAAWTKGDFSRGNRYHALMMKEAARLTETGYWSPE